MSTSTLSAVDASTGDKIPLATFDDANGNTVVGHVALTGTPLVPVAPGNPLPVTDASAEAALSTLGTNTAATMVAAGTPGDAAWGGSGSGTVVALLKALYGKLAGTLTTTVSGVTIVSGSAAVGAAPVDPPLSVSGVDAQGLKRHFLTDGNGVIQVAQIAPLPTGTNTIGGVTVSGTPTVTVGNLPATQAVTGIVALGAGSEAIGTVGVTGTVAVVDSAAEASLATTATNTGATVIAAGTPGDVAWTGAGPGSLVAVLKALYGKIGGTLTASLLGSLPAGTNALGSVSVSNLPATQAVSGTVGVSGTVAVQDAIVGAAIGTAADTASTSGNGSAIALLKQLRALLGGTLATSVSNFPATQSVSGSISVSNLPAIQSVSGTVALGAGSQAIGTVGVTGIVAVADSAAGASLATIATNTAIPTARVLVSRSVASTAANASTTLVAANAARRLLRVQAPQGAGVWLNLLGGTAGANGPDCLYLAPGDVFEGQDTNAATYWCATGGLVLSAWEA